MYNQKIGKTAIVVFIRSLEEEARIKSFSYFKSKNQTKHILNELNKATIQISKKTQLPVIIGNERIQKGNTFGERINSVCEYSFDQGFENLIIIGNDCLSIDNSTLIQVEKQLNQDEVVLGPSSDGGIYLLGLTKNAFQSIDLINQPWQTSSLFDSLNENIEKYHLAISILNIATDIDNILELEKELNLLSVFSPLRKKIFSLLAIIISSFENIRQFSYQFFLRKSFLRGPPLLR